MNRSAVTAALVPDGVVTLTLTVPAGRAGDRTVICVSEATFTFVPGVTPNPTAVAPVNPVPVIVTRVLPVVDPFFGDMLVIAGGGT